MGGGIAVPGAMRLKTDDFSAVIRCAKEIGILPERTGERIPVGFHHSVILGAAPAIIDAVKKGDITRFFVIGGCDGAEPGRPGKRSPIRQRLEAGEVTVRSPRRLPFPLRPRAVDRLRAPDPGPAPRIDQVLP